MTLLSSLSSKLKQPRPGSEMQSDLPPRYSEVVESSHHISSSEQLGDFDSTVVLQVQAVGYDVNQALTGRTLENISVFRVGSTRAEYTSVRLKKNSNSCALVRVSDEATLISTIYRWGPGRHPRMRILSPHSNIPIEDAIKDHNVQGELIEVKSHSIVSRAQVFDTSFGKFEWRYGTREEQAASHADCLLVMERIDQIPLHGGGQSKSGVRVAQLIRNDRFRTPGTKKYSGGNGGRLFIDMRMWNEDKHTDTQTIEAFVVASCILMLKREADRFIDNHLALVV